MTLEGLNLQSLINLVMSDSYSRLSISEKNNLALLILKKKMEMSGFIRNRRYTASRVYDDKTEVTE